MQHRIHVRSATSLLPLVLAAAFAACSRSDEADPQAQALVDAIFEARSGVTAADVARLEQEIAACMEREGFAYVAGTARPVVGSDEVAGYWRKPDRDRAASDGFGVVTGMPAAADDTTPEASGADLLVGMSDAQREAYEAALYGNGDNLGCASEQSAAAAAEGAPTEAVIRTMGDLLDASSVLPDLERSWSDCMRERGFEVQSESEAIDLVVQRVQAATAQTGDGSLPESEIATLRSFEQRLAVADVACIEPLHRKLEDELLRVARAALES